MVWQRMIRPFADSLPTRHRKPGRKRRRRLLMERLDRREVLAANIGAIAGVAFTDQALDGLTPDDPRLEGITVELYADNGSGNAGSLVTSGGDADTLIGTDTTDGGADPVPGQYRFDDLAPGDYWVVQSAVAGLQAPSEQLVTVTNDGGVQIVQIDDYSTTSQMVTADNTTPTVSDSANAPEAVGSARDIQSNNTNGLGQLTVFIDDTNDQLSIGSLGDAEGDTLIQYDGADAAITLDATGLGGVALGGGSPGGDVAAGAGLHVVTRAENAGDDLVVTVYTDAANFSTITIPIPQDTTDFIETFLPFSDFTVGGGSGADFNDVGAIEASVALSANNDLFVSIVETLEPEVVTRNLANVQPLELGGQLFFDDGSNPGELNNGVQDAGEGGVPTGTTVDLYQVAGPNDSVNVGVDAPIASTTTGAGGTYNVTGLQPGHYVVVVPESNFQASANLEGYGTSTGNDPAGDPDDNVDGDDNGRLVTGLGVSGGTISLVSNSEPTDDDDADNNTNTTVDFGFIPQVDLGIIKSLNNAQSDDVPGGTVVFDIEVTNNGPLDATSVEVEDVVPAGLTFDSIQNASGSFTPTVSGSTVTVAMGSLAVGASGSFQLVATIDSGQTSDITNTAAVSTADQVDVDNANDSADAVVDLVESDLSVVKADATDPVNAGEQLVYTITVTNNGPDDAAGVEVSDPLPSGVTFVSGDVDGDSGAVSHDSGTNELTATVGTLANAASAVVTVTVEVASDASSPLTNSATVTASPDTDPDQTNNETSEDTAVDRLVDVAIDKSITGAAVAGGTVTYTVDVSNNGPGDARGVSVVDTLVGELTFDSFDAGTSGATLAQNGQDLTFSLGTIASGASATFTFDASLDASATGTLSNAATVSTTDSDSDSTNDTDNVDATVQRQVDLILDKTVDLATAVPGQDQLIYTYTISHDTDSVSDAEDVDVTDTLPEGVVGQSIAAPTADNTDFDSATRTATVSLDSIPIGETRSFTITVDIAEDATGSLVNQASVASIGTELDNTNNDDTATTTLTPEFDVTVSKTVDDETPDPGATVVYAIEVDNSGPSTATGVTVTDAVPTGLTFVSGSLDGQGATLNGSDVEFPALTLASGATATGTLTFTVDNDTTGTVTNTATVTADAGETDTTNNSGSDDIDVTPIVDLEIDKTVDVTDDAQPGSTLTYAVTVTNNGPSDATGVEVVDTLPSGVTFVSGSGPNNEALSESGGEVIVDGGTIADGDDITFTIVVTVDSGVSGDLVNTATVSGDVNDTDTSNDTDSATTEVDPLNSSIAGTVYVDANSNGTFDDGEEGIAGVQITLSGTDALGNAVNRTAITDADGEYIFSSLPEGTYAVTETQPAGFADGQEEAGTGATATVNDDVFTELGLAADTDAVGFNFGELIEPLSKRRFLASS